MPGNEANGIFDLVCCFLLRVLARTVKANVLICTNIT